MEIWMIHPPTVLKTALKRRVEFDLARVYVYVRVRVFAFEWFGVRYIFLMK